jgi:multiple sugar transport system permease protein
MGYPTQRRLQRLLVYALLLLGLGVVAVPFWYMVVTSLKPQSFIFEMPPRLWPTQATLSNYTAALGKDHFGLYFANSLVVAVSSTALTVLVSGMLAYAFARLDFPGREALFYVVLVGMMIPPVMLIIPQFIVAKFLDKYFDLLNSLRGLVVVYVTMNLSLQTFLLRGFFESLPRDLEEAALIDGASRWTIFRRIVLPLSRSGLAVVTIFTFLYAWDEFPWANVAIKETTRRTLPIAIALFQSEHLTEWGQVFAASIVALIPVVVVFVVFQRYFIRGIATTGLKG